MNGEPGEDESKSRGLTVDLGWSIWEVELCTDEAGDIERLQSSFGKFRAPGGGGGVGENESLLLFEDLTRIDCEVALLWIGGVGEMESLLCICLIGTGCALGVLWVEEEVGELKFLLNVCLSKTG